MEGYVAAKQRICSGGSQDDVGVICIDDSYAVAMYQELQTSDRKLIAVSTKQSIPQGVYVDNGVLTDQDQHFPIDQFEHLPGAHNAQNIAVAYVVCRAYGIEGGSIIKAVSSFGGLDHRLQIVGKYGNVSFVNDSKATNAEATSHALKAFDEIYWIVGGKAKEGGIDSLSPYFSNIRHAFLIGEAASEFANTLEGSVAYTSSGDLEAATVQAFAKASEKGGVVLLSPACASFDQWPSFEARGEAFCQYVSALQHEAA
jgi:UDP-N-acetylmuramoylalanine--D-glutamate ligase